MVRHERALRALTRWEGDDPFDPVCRVYRSVGWLSHDLVARGRGSGTQITVPLLRLLASHAASTLKVAQHCAVFDVALVSMQVSSCWQALIPELIPLDGKGGETRSGQLTATEMAAIGAAAPAVICLLLPRLAALSPVGITAAAAHMPGSLRDPPHLDVLFYLTSCLKCGPARTLRLLTSCHTMRLMLGPYNSLLEVMDSSSDRSSAWDLRQGIGRLGDFACNVARQTLQLVCQGGDGAPVGSPELRDLLAQPLLQLLGSPLLDLLARMQHVPIDARNSVTSLPFRSAPWGLVPLHEMPETMQPDADDAAFGMQVNSRLLV